MPTPGWGVVIRGDPEDLSVWQHMLKHPSDVWVETHNGETVLRATSLDKLESAPEVLTRASAYIDRLNGAMALSHGSRSVQFGRTIIKFTSDGRSVWVEGAQFEVSTSLIAGAATGIGPDGKPVPPAPSEVQRWSEIADQETWLNEALIFFGRAFGRATNDSWFDIYKAL
jgi:hypothetical protein